MPKFSEPIFEKIPSYMELLETYNWYGENYSWADSKKFIIEYLLRNGHQNKSKIVKYQSEHEICWVCGWIARLLTNGSKVLPQSQEYLDKYIETIK